MASDRTGRRAVLVASRLNEQLELTWRGMNGGRLENGDTRYDRARRHAQALGFEYLESAHLLHLPLEAQLARLEALSHEGVARNVEARAALLGTEKRPIFKLSQLFEEYEVATKDEVRDLSPNQLAIWRNGRIRAVERFVAVVGNKPITDLTQDDAIDYCDWWRGRILKDKAAAKTANKDIGQLSRMIKDMTVRRRLGLADIFKGLRLRGETEKARAPYETDFIRDKLLAPDALAGLNEDAKLILHVVAETGLRLSEVVNLTASAIRLEAAIPHIRVLPEGRRLKTDESERDMPLVGVALAAIKLRPGGFPHYRDRASALSATLNKFLMENGLRPSKDHTVYSLRHSFKDRLVAAEAPDSLIDSLMGHKTYKPKYGKGPSLELKLKFLMRIVVGKPSLSICA